MTSEISDTCMFLAPTKDIWDAIQQTYSKARDAAQVYEVKVKTIAAKQGSKTITEYANQLKALWQELDHYRVIKTKCPENAAILKDFIEQDRVYDFLVGHNPEFNQVRIQILGKQERQSVEKEQGQSLVHLLQETKAHKVKCWKLNDKPPSREWGNRGEQQRPQAHIAEQPKTEENSATSGFNSEEMGEAKKFVGIP
ncbi:hypothetical protein CK203_036868 [Vitis vinifera]|uniref:Retrotransposon gag domain-containing protein n=1 Tax=Vitis vinifera TaxID=29760 RepID=A0A438GXN9_VITVI|nr:hypothetical protein CK203_036868 [Vitis vinifera]